MSNLLVIARNVRAEKTITSTHVFLLLASVCVLFSSFILSVFLSFSVGSFPSFVLTFSRTPVISSSPRKYFHDTILLEVQCPVCGHLKQTIVAALSKSTAEDAQKFQMHSSSLPDSIEPSLRQSHPRSSQIPTRTEDPGSRSIHCRGRSLEAWITSVCTTQESKSITSKHSFQYFRLQIFASHSSMVSSKTTCDREVKYTRPFSCCVGATWTRNESVLIQLER